MSEIYQSILDIADGDAPRATVILCVEDIDALRGDGLDVEQSNGETIIRDTNQHRLILINAKNEVM